MPKTRLNQRGFTLIELLVVVLVISALSGIVISLINSGGFRQKAEDTQRVSDLKQIQTALELYFSDNRLYPITSGWVEVTGVDAVSTTLSPTYINKMPADPKGIAGQSAACGSPEIPRYNYISSSNGASYILTATTALANSVVGHECADLNNWGSFGSCSGDLTHCYGVENP